MCPTGRWRFNSRLRECISIERLYAHYRILTLKMIYDIFTQNPVLFRLYHESFILFLFLLLKSVCFAFTMQNVYSTFASEIFSFQFYLQLLVCIYGVIEIRNVCANSEGKIDRVCPASEGKIRDVNPDTESKIMGVHPTSDIKIGHLYIFSN